MYVHDHKKKLEQNLLISSIAPLMNAFNPLKFSHELTNSYFVFEAEKNQLSASECAAAFADVKAWPQS